MPTEIPRWGSEAYRPDPGDLFEGIGRAPHQIALGLVRENGVQFVNPAVDADLVAFGDNPALLVRVEQRGHRRHVKAGLDPVFFEHLQNSRHAHPAAILAPGEPADRVAAIAQIAGLVIAVERQGYRAARPARPLRRPQAAPGADTLDALAPLLLGPLPGFEIRFASVHAVFLVGASASGEGDGIGRSGEIRTLDPQHPMLMRYQAALRSDRAAPAEVLMIVVGNLRRNPRGLLPSDGRCRSKP